MPPKKPTPKPILLNEEQRAVVGVDEGFYAVYAGPGSGKSQCVTMRFARLIREGVDPNLIISLSFTRTAAKNLRERVEQQTGPLSINRTNAGASTFHGFALAFIQEERAELGLELAEFPLATEPIANKLSAKAASRFEVDARTLRTSVSLQKRNRVRPAEAIRQAEAGGKSSDIKLALAYKEYDKLLKAEGTLDFDGLMEETVNLLEKKSAVRDRWQFKFVMADESQDNCITDWQLLKLLSSKYGGLMCVGDPGQSVFGFRGASPKLFLEMGKMFPGTQKLFLATNYRSSRELVQFLKSIGPVPELASRFTTPNASGPSPVVRGFKNSQDEADFVVKSIRGDIS